MELERQHFSRIKTLHRIFAAASGEAYEKFLDLQEVIAGSLDDEVALLDSEESSLVAGIQAIVMSVMCFEAAIYDYAAIHLGDRYVRRNLDRLDLIAKWTIIPQLVCEKKLRKDRLPFSTFQHVVSERNRLVHWKSQAFRFDDVEQVVEGLQQENARFEGNIHRSFRAIVLMSFEMDELLGPHFNPLPTFDRERVCPWVYSSRLGEIIDECRRKVERTTPRRL